MQKAVADPNRRTPPNRAGAHAFRQSRLTALALLILVPYALWVLAGIAGRDLAVVRQVLSLPFNGLALLLLVAIGAWHMRLGMNEILEDYLGKPALPLWQTINSLFCLLIVVLAGGALLRLWLWS